MEESLRAVTVPNLITYDLVLPRRICNHPGSIANVGLYEARRPCPKSRANMEKYIPIVTGNRHDS